MSPRRANPPRQVAAVCYRVNGTGPIFLLVRTYDGLWTFPKGQIDSGMTEAEAAENEAFEEAGATGSMEMRPFASYRYVKGGMERNGGGEIVVSAYLLAVRETRPPMEVHRDPEWFEPEEAKQALAAGRSGRYARELARVVDAAVARLTGRPL